ncbi:MAG: CDP-2,3-bis-(O-geranylgeranyl)-sn-glycerol synthase [Candidatus Bilamarchaeaceae archaeon]
MDLVALIIFLLPCYFANAAPVVLGGGARMDFGAMLPDGRDLLGKTKTIRGFIGGVAAGIVVAGISALLFPTLLFGDQKTLFLSGALLSIGALVGDAVGSFIKRRMGVPSGKPLAFVDQLDFLAGALIFAYPVANQLYSPETLTFFVATTFLLHIASNSAANRLGLKKVPW